MPTHGLDELGVLGSERGVRFGHHAFITPGRLAPHTDSPGPRTEGVGTGPRAKRL
jgi:hypothetical protein